MDFNNNWLSNDCQETLFDLQTAPPQKKNQKTYDWMIRCNIIPVYLRV